MSASLKNETERRRYGLLLKAQLPTVIHTEAENKHWLSVLQQLDRKDSLNPEEEEFADLLTVLVEDFEDRNYALTPVSPVDVLEELIEANNLKQRDLLDIFKTESIASEVLNRKRRLTTEHIEKIVNRFHVSADLFFPKAAHAGTTASV
jgi:HTH-type transcriptional regulator / antitoxin HigA